jgi:hypothetical protein
MNAVVNTMQLWELKELWELLNAVPVDDAGKIVESWNIFDAGTDRAVIDDWMRCQNHEFNPVAVTDLSLFCPTRTVLVPRIMPSSEVNAFAEACRLQPYHVILASRSVAKPIWQVVYNEKNDARTERLIMQFDDEKGMKGAMILADRLNTHHFWHCILHKLAERASALPA